MESYGKARPPANLEQEIAGLKDQLATANENWMPQTKTCNLFNERAAFSK